jgi:redox-sensitive bicupin YhaK (pirin superfamily)
MNLILHKASQRGYADHGWLQATHSFSFANYYDNEKMHFGKLRVLNDDVVAPSHGFDLHPHQDMEIITIPLSGRLRHSDNVGNEEVISAGEVQVMTAGSGIWHSEYNASDTDELNLFQIWIFTNKRKLKPRYDQKKFDKTERLDKWQLLVSPNGQSESLSINQSAYISLIESRNEKEISYQLKEQGNGVYLMLIEGKIEIENNILEKRDAIGLWNFLESVEILFHEKSKLLAIEVPMN